MRGHHGRWLEHTPSICRGESRDDTALVGLQPACMSPRSNTPKLAYPFCGVREDGVLDYTSSPVDFHVVAYPDAQPYIEKNLFGLVNRPVHDVRAFFYPLTQDAKLARLDRTVQGMEGRKYITERFGPHINH